MRLGFISPYVVDPPPPQKKKKKKKKIVNINVGF